jgi:hypothetical protein
MDIKVIKELVAKYAVEQLQNAEESLLEGNVPEIEIEGQDEGEQLTHVLAAIFCQQEMNETGCTINEAIRAYSKKVRNSIS